MRLLLASTLLFFHFFALAQNTLVLDKPGKRKRIKYNSGDVIYLKLNDGSRFAGRISAIGAKSIFIDEEQLLISEIEKLYDPDKRKFHRSTAYKAFSAAAVAIVFSTANNVFNEEKGPVLDQAGTNVTLFFLAVGAIFLPMQSKKYKIGSWRIRSMDLRPG